MKATPKLISRLAFVGLTIVLGVLASVAVWAVTMTEGVAGDATHAVQLSDLFQHAQNAFSLETALQHEYQAELRPPLLRRSASAGALAERELRRAMALDPAVTEAVRSVIARHHQYVLAIHNLNSALSSGHLNAARHIDRTVIDPLQSQLTAAIDGPAQREESLAVTELRDFGSTRSQVQTTTFAVVSLGLLLLLPLWWLFRSLRRRLESENASRKRVEGRLHALVEQLPVAAYMGPLDPTASTLYISPEIEAMLGYSAAEWIEDVDFWPKVLHPEDRERVLAAHAAHMATHERFRCDYRMMAHDGRSIWVRDEAIVAPDGPGGPLMQLGVMVDITERHRAEEALEHQALHDGLTDLPNRTLLFDRLEQAILLARRDHSPLVLLLMDLDRFKEVNDTFGHHYGDVLLQQVGTRLRTVLRESDSVARLGGDEFALLLPGVDCSGAIVAVQKLLQVLRQPYRVDGHVLDVGASVGIAVYPSHGDTANTLMQRADVAMYAAKRMDGGYAVYEPNADPYSPSRLALISDLRHAIEHNELAVAYQPKERFKVDGLSRVEALVRWEHHQRGTIPPDEFVPLAEHAGLIKPLTIWVLNSALQQSREWHEHGSQISVAVNLSPRILHDPDLVPTITQLLEDWGAAPCWLEVEVTEGALMLDPAGALETLTRLHDMGIAIAIDDFGTGYSSLGYLKRLPADHIKIDKSFVTGMAENDDSAFIVRSVIDLGHNLDLEVVAEGVEDGTTWDLLADMECDVAQGYFLSRPMPPDDVPRWFNRRKLSVVDEAS